MIAASGAAAQQPDPQPLWNAYPLDQDQGAAGGSAQKAAATTTTPTSPATTQVTVTERAGDGPPWVLMIVAAAGGALFVVVLLTLQGRRARRRDEALVGVTDEWPWLTASARGDAREFRAARLRNGTGERTANGTAAEWVAERDPVVGPERAAHGVAGAERVGDEAPREPAPEAAAVEPVAEAAAAPVGEAAAAPVDEAADEQDVAAQPPDNGAGETDFDVTEATTVPRHRFDREGTNGRPVASRRGPICQVRWSGPGACFYAVTTDADGVEHRLAWSPPIEWDQDGPPDEESREARAALRVLAKDLRDKGWKPMRAKGDDFDETRWYARRFRFPVVEGDDDATPWLAAAAHRHD